MVVERITSYSFEKNEEFFNKKKKKREISFPKKKKNRSFSKSSFLELHLNLILYERGT